MATDLRRIPGVAPKGRRRLGPRHRDTWTFGAAPPRSGERLLRLRRARRPALGRRRRIPAVTAAGAHGVSVVQAFLRVEVTVDGLTDNAILTSAALAERSIRFSVKPSEHL